MKMYKKEALELKDGLLIDPATGDVVMIDPDIIDLANELETNYQKALYLNAQPSAVKAPSLEGFVRESVDKIELFIYETPIHKKREEEALAFMDELDDIEVTERMNQMLLGMNELVQFVKNDNVIGMEASKLRRFDTPKLGNPLEWTEKTVTKAVAIINGCTVADKDEDSE